MRNVTGVLHAGDLPVRLQASYAVTRWPAREHFRAIRPEGARLEEGELVPQVRNDSHLAEDCGDPECPRFGCVMYRRGYAHGFDRGYARGWEDGYSDGYAAGYSAGYAAGLAAGDR